MIKSNLVGQRFGRLLVTAQTDSQHNRTRWVCLCDCGITIISTSRALLHDNRKSCGCLRIEMAKEKRSDPRMNTSLPEGEGAFNVLFSVYTRNAMLRGLTFELNKEVFKELTKQNCYFCKAIPSQSFSNAGICKTQYIYNGIDRLDNKVGYVKSNCVPCCKVCNSMKSNKSYEDFITKCKIIVETARDRQK